MHGVLETINGILKEIEGILKEVKGILKRINGILWKSNGILQGISSCPWNGAVLKGPGPRITNNATKSFTEASRNLHGIALSFSEEPGSGRARGTSSYADTLMDQSRKPPSLKFQN